MSYQYFYDSVDQTKLSNGLVGYLGSIRIIVIHSILIRVGINNIKHNVYIFNDALN